MSKRLTAREKKVKDISEKLYDSNQVQKLFDEARKVFDDDAGEDNDAGDIGDWMMDRIFEDDDDKEAFRKKHGLSDKEMQDVLENVGESIFAGLT